MVEFVSYNGRYPNLCSGDLIMKIDGETVKFPPYCMTSGGFCCFTAEWDEIIETGEWQVEIPERYEAYRDEILEAVNSNVRHGCCGGCL